MARRTENNRFDDHATTLWLAGEESKPKTVANCKPFGWAELCERTPLLEEEFEKKEKEWKDARADRKEMVPISNNGSLEISDIKTSPMAQSEKTPKPEIWEQVILLYAPNTGTISTKWENKNGSTKDKSIIPVSIVEQLKKKKKAVAAKVKVELIGGKEYRIVEISD